LPTLLTFLILKSESGRINRKARYWIGENLKVIFAKFSTLTKNILLHSQWVRGMHTNSCRVGKFCPGFVFSAKIIKWIDRYDTFQHSWVLTNIVDTRKYNYEQNSRLFRTNILLDQHLQCCVVSSKTERDKLYPKKSKSSKTFPF